MENEAIQQRMVEGNGIGALMPQPILVNEYLSNGLRKLLKPMQRYSIRLKYINGGELAMGTILGQDLVRELKFMTAGRDAGQILLNIEEIQTQLNSESGRRGL